MSDLFLMIAIPAIVIGFAFIAHCLEYRNHCYHKWSTWADPENTGVNVIQRRTCEKCNLMDSRVVIANASIETCEDDHVAIPDEGKPAQAVDKEARA